MDELWEVLTLMQTKKMSSHHLILIYGRKYWHKVIDWRHMVHTGTVSEREYKMLQFADTVDEAFDHVRRQMEKRHLDLDVDRFAARPRSRANMRTRHTTTRRFQLLRISPSGAYVLGDFRVSQEHGVEAPLFVPVVQQDHRGNPQRPLAATRTGSSHPADPGRTRR